jgi:hypothetical protein
MDTKALNLSAQECFPPEVCPACGYSLTGLPSIGVCPECGIAYDDSQLILYGWACGTHATPSNSRGKRFFFALFPILFLWQIFQPWISREWRLTLAIMWMASLGLNLLRRKTIDHPGGVQVRLNRKGVVQVDDLSALRERPAAGKQLVPWKEIEMVTWKQLSDDRLRVQIKLLMPRYTPAHNPLPVDAEVNCNCQQAEKLHAMIEDWRER